ncbi:hypothetical protein [Ramlibacter tataouinensis]|uniref:Uncharacterized protein n=1 Tax=Ramlibacter tataouinensis (strain ATCC BAA-407 / DSM 14655 / LMG 21543 / TTB310) TaxID=365046 RepID=F5XX92_RAMTT|nr:hypothetical protein [Ramlibacter tataouinensis]AEG93036.1 conserved hypothetical protein [Ramlibacter tataouinensis TTB310]
MAGRPPSPRFVPTLTEVVKPAGEAAPPVPAGVAEEQLVHRVMQRVEQELDKRLREAIATVVIEHTRTLGPLLRQEVEAAVRQAVSQALADESAAAAQRR